MRRLLRSRALRVGFAVAAVALLVLALVDQWPHVREYLAALSWQWVLGSLVAVLVGLFLSLLSWRVVMADLGAPLPLRASVQIFFIGQLGKYVPGSVWPVLAQMELGADHDVPRRTSAAAAMVGYVVNVITAGLVFVVTLPLVAHSALSLVLALGGVAAGLVLLWPAVLNRLIGWGLARMRQQPLEHPLSVRGLLLALAWGLGVWVCYGLHVYLLAVGSGASPSPSLFATCTGGYAVAWVTGFLFVVAPAGAGVREATLSLALSSVLPAGAPLAVSLVSRLVMTVGDLAWGGVGILLVGHGRLAAIRADARRTQADEVELRNPG